MNKEKLESLALEFKKSSEDWEILKELVEGETDKILETETSKVSESVTKSKFAGTQVNTKYQVSKTSEKKESSEIPEYVFE
ncbi:MAG: hypothetical protein LBD88_04915 [Candidatus Peribacteria bacterium]|jgi:hypothetical protein|nr:hypothetical protein [Candidatus Peribacteria bacterium]